jgi:galactose mutarotase-like enzyme
MPFQIGDHPAFYYPDYKADTKERGFFSFDRSEDIEYILIKEKGCADPEAKYPLQLKNGMLPIDTSSFDRDAFIIEDSQVGKVTLHRQDGAPWLALSFDAPLVGLWSPPGKNAPFVCIEPWYGRCDRVGFDGQFVDRDWVNVLSPGDTFHGEYSIEIL